MGKTVFISYCSEDREFADEICRVLEQERIDCWIAPRDVAAGKAYGEQIIDAIEHTAVMVLVLSARANASSFVSREVERAVSKDKTLIPFRIENVEPARALELFVSGRQWIDAWEPPLGAKIQRLAKAIRELPDSPADKDTGHGTPPAGLTKTAVRSPWRARAVAALVVVAAFAGAFWKLIPGGPSPPIVEPPSLKPSPAPQITPVQANTIAVMEFENLHADDTKNNWFCKALQTTLNTELSGIPQLNVVAPEIIDRTAREAGVDRLTAARRLGVGHVISGSFQVFEDNLRIDAGIVETANGFQEAVEPVEGGNKEFFVLQKQIAHATAVHLKVRLTSAQEARLAKTTNSRLDKYQMLLGAEGVTESPSKRESTPGPQARSGTTMMVTRWFNSAFATGLRLQSLAYAQIDPATAEAAAMHLLDEYRRAHEAGDIERLASLYVSFPESQRQSLTAYLKDVVKLQVELVNVKVQPRERDVAVSYTRRDRFVDKDTGEPVSLEVRVTKFIVPRGSEWKFAD